MAIEDSPEAVTITRDLARLPWLHAQENEIMKALCRRNSYCAVRFSQPPAADAAREVLCSYVKLTNVPTDSCGRRILDAVITIAEKYKPTSSAQYAIGGFPPHPRNCSNCICPGRYGGPLCKHRSDIIVVHNQRVGKEDKFRGHFLEEYAIVGDAYLKDLQRHIAGHCQSSYGALCTRNYKKYDKLLCQNQEKYVASYRIKDDVTVRPHQLVLEPQA
ncbi:unnamed protein product [Heligmosomoides polygyrus]|uniref:SWIM-type domain-containing protein n=1 Tax=Heligmosomoides polygyrus TaxID=6339 RepID=A0A3P8E0F2_HELPZ|nr:unnamed protein product [Heligmosomoides polygyrus]